jgi:DNA-binding LytR/AlgR family response regulator
MTPSASEFNAPHIRGVLADDERLLREQLQSRLMEVWPELEIVAVARNGMEAVEKVEEHRPDVVFLDIRMPGVTGIEAAARIAQMPIADDEWLPEIVFITAYDQYAVEAFEQGACDYVLKPAERDRLLRTVQRVRRRLAARAGAPAGEVSRGAGSAPSMDALPASSSDETELAAAMPKISLQQLLHRLTHPQGVPAYLQWIQASVGTNIQMIPVDEVLFFMSDEKYTRVQTPTTEALIRKPIKELLEELDPGKFWQIHRSTLVAVQAIAAVTRDLRGRQIINIKGHPQKLEVSRSYNHLFKGM